VGQQFSGVFVSIVIGLIIAIDVNEVFVMGRIEDLLKIFVILSLQSWNSNTNRYYFYLLLLVK